MPLTLRPAEPGERDAVVALTRACLAPDDRGDAGDLERLLWDEPRARGLGVVAERDGWLVGNASGSLGAPDDTGGPPAYVTMLTVGGTERRAGIGGKLLRTLETKCRTRGATSIQTGGSAPVYWWPGVDTRCSAEIAFFRAMGYDVTREAMNLSVDLVRNRALVTEPASEGLPVRRLGGEEWPEFGAWMERTWGATWAEEARRSLSRRPTSCFVVSDGVEYLGFAAYDTNRRGCFGPMGSTPGARGRGVGTALLRACLSDYLAQGLRSCEIAWVGPVEFYERAVGARVGRRFVQLRKALDAGRSA